MDNLPAAALERFNAYALEHLNDLKDLVRIPSISFPGFDPAPLTRCSRAVEALLVKSGLPDVRILDTGAGFPPCSVNG
jgi:acetylornithine deacetylase/succinyl-diaminopimelate desuccinylase-like protein